MPTSVDRDQVQQLLERLGFDQVYDYVDGKSDWMAYNLPVEGEEGPFAGSAVVEPPTCGPDEAASEVARRLQDRGGERAAVLDERRIVLGLAGRQELREAVIRPGWRR